MKHLLRLITTICTLVLLFSCSDSFLGLNADKSLNDVKIKSLKPWGILKKGQSITFSIISPAGGEIPDRLEMNLFNILGENVKKLETTSFALNDDLVLDPFISLMTGQYKLEFLTYSGTTLLANKNISFFYIDSDFLVKGIESFPSGIYPGAHVLLRSILQIPPNSDPFLRWTIDEKIITKGRFSEGKSKIIWTAPEDEGVYTIRLELFPVSPHETDNFVSRSEIYMDIELFVSNLQAPSRTKLLPETSYYSLFHFDGNFTDSGSGIIEEALKNQEKPKAFAIGNPELITKEDDFGYTISNSTGFVIPYCIFPVEQGHLAPFTLSIGLDLDEGQTDKTIFSYVSEDNSFNINIFIDNFSNLFAQVKLDSQVMTLPAEINFTNIEKRFLVSLSLIPSLTDITAIWFLDGIRTNKVVTPVNGNRNMSSIGTLTIGGERGAAGVIYELGTFYKDAKGRATVDPGLYKSAMVQKYQGSLIFAEGFESLYIPEDVKVGGRAWMDADGLSFESVVEIRLSGVPKNNTALSVALDFLSFTDESGSVEFYWDTVEEPFLKVSPTGKVITGDKEIPKVLASASKFLRFKIHDNLTLLSFSGDKVLKNLPITRPTGQPEQLIIIIKNTDPKKPVTLDTVTVVTEKK